VFWLTSWDIKNLSKIEVRTPTHIFVDNKHTFEQHSLPLPCLFLAYQLVDPVSSAPHGGQKCLLAIGYPTSPSLTGSLGGLLRSCRIVQIHVTSGLHE